MLRIDDLDQQRVRREYVQDIFDTLDFLEIRWHEGPKDYQDFIENYSQVHRAPLYVSVLDELREKQRLFTCRCSRSETGKRYQGKCLGLAVPADGPGVCWRFDTNKIERPVMRTTEGVLNVDFPGEHDHFIVCKKDGQASYQLSSVVDDMHFGVDLVVRGKDLLSSTLAQLALAGAMDDSAFTNVTFFHHPLMTATSGAKLSKSDGATSVQYLRKKGMKPAGIYSLIARQLFPSAKLHETNAREMILREILPA